MCLEKRAQQHSIHQNEQLRKEYKGKLKKLEDREVDVKNIKMLVVGLNEKVILMHINLHTYTRAS